MSPDITIDTAHGREDAAVAAAPDVHELAAWRVQWRIEKRHEDLGALDISADEFMRHYQPYEVAEYEHNLLVNEGINLMLSLLIGGAGTAYNNANARIGVGDSSTAAAATQTDLQAATNKLYKAMDATYPTLSGQTVTFRSQFIGTEANWQWNEWTIDNGATAAINLNRRVETTLGTKASGTWTLLATVTIS